MTAACPGGATSEPNGSISNVVIFTSIALASYLNNKGAAWAYALAPLLGTLTFNLQDFCAGEPPPMPVVTTADVLSWFLPTNIHGITDLRTAMGNLVGNLLWYDACRCTGATQPVPPATTADPGGFTINPPTLTPAAPLAPCVHNTDANIAPGANPENFTLAILVDPLPRVTAGRLAWFWLPSGLGSPSAALFNITLYGSHQQVLATIPQFRPLSNDSGSVDFIVPPGLVQVVLNIQSDSFPNPNRLSYELSLFCDTGPVVGVTTPCCPPDSSVQLTLAAVRDLVTLIQRQAVAFATVHGALHAGLVGDGEIAVADLIGARVMPVTVPQWAGVTAGDPEQLWLDSWIAWGNADGFSERVWLRSAPFLSFPAEAGQYTRIGFHLAGNLAVDLTEILREQ